MLQRLNFPWIDQSKYEAIYKYLQIRLLNKLINYVFQNVVQSFLWEITYFSYCLLYTTFVNLLHIFRIPFPTNTSGWLLLKG